MRNVSYRSIIGQPSLEMKACAMAKSLRKRKLRMARAAALNNKELCFEPAPSVMSLEVDGGAAADKLARTALIENQRTK